MITLSPTIRQIALDEFTRRRAIMLDQAAKMGDSWPGDPANENLRLWLAIALAAGVGRDLPADVCAFIEVRALFPEGRKFLPGPGQIAEEQAWKAELARARDAAIAKAEHGNIPAGTRAHNLITLAEALGAPPYQAARQERNAA